MELTVSVMTAVIFLISLATWALIGLLFWIPILIRATTVFSGAVLYATLTGQKADAWREYLHVASAFYADGFRITTEALYPKKGSPSPKAIEFHARRFMLEVLWTTAFWGVALWIGRPDLLKPLTARIGAVWDSFRSIVTSFPVAAGIVAVVLTAWGVYLSLKVGALHESIRLYHSERHDRSIEHERSLSVLSEHMKNHDRHLETINRLIESLRKETKPR